MSDIASDYPFDEVRSAIRKQELEPLSEEDGYRWGLSHIEYVKMGLLKLEEKALTRRDVGLLHDIAISRLRAAEVEEELRKKLDEKQ